MPSLCVPAACCWRSRMQYAMPVTNQICKPLFVVVGRIHIVASPIYNKAKSEWIAGRQAIPTICSTEVFFEILAEIIFATLRTYQEGPAVDKGVEGEELSKCKKNLIAWNSCFGINTELVDLLIVVINVSSSTVVPRLKQSNADTSKLLVLLCWNVKHHCREIPGTV